MNVSIVTFNIFGVPFSKLSIRLNRVCAVLAGLNVDIINLQQVHTYSALHQVAKRLPQSYKAVYVSGLLGPKAGLVTFTKLRVADRKLHQMNRASNLLGVNVKGALAVETENLTIFNTHLSANTNGEWSNKSRFYKMHRAQLIALNKLIAKANPKPVIIGGDFNVPGDSELFSTFAHHGNLLDAFDGDFRPTFHKEFLPAGEPGRRIDQILIADGGQQCRVTETSRLFDELVGLWGVKLMYLSDHSGLYANIEMTLPSMKALAP